MPEPPKADAENRYNRTKTADNSISSQSRQPDVNVEGADLVDTNRRYDSASERSGRYTRADTALADRPADNANATDRYDSPGKRLQIPDIKNPHRPIGMHRLHLPRQTLRIIAMVIGKAALDLQPERAENTQWSMAIRCSISHVANLAKLHAGRRFTILIQMCWEKISIRSCPALK